MNDFKNAAETLARVIQDISNQIKPVTNILANAFKDFDFKGLAEAIKKLPPQTRRVQNFLAVHGWYLSGNCLPVDISRLDGYIQEGNESAVQEFMINYVSSEFERIKVNVCCSWSERSKILTDAFNAHKQELYSLSIPVMLAQADGISHDLLGVSFYSKSNSVPKTSKAYRDKLGEQVNEDEFTDAFFLGPLNVLSSIAFNTDFRDKERQEGRFFGPLNRHGVLHGRDVDYATQANGLRAVVMLDYLTELRIYFKDE